MSLIFKNIQYVDFKHYICYRLMLWIQTLCYNVFGELQNALTLKNIAGQKANDLKIAHVYVFYPTMKVKCDLA